MYQPLLRSFKCVFIPWILPGNPWKKSCFLTRAHTTKSTLFQAVWQTTTNSIQKMWMYNMVSKVLARSAARVLTRLRSRGRSHCPGCISKLIVLLIDGYLCSPGLRLSAPGDYPLEFAEGCLPFLFQPGRTMSIALIWWLNLTNFLSSWPLDQAYRTSPGNVKFT